MLFVLLVQVANAAAPALEEGALHWLLLLHVQGSIPHELDASSATAGCNACNGFAATWVADLLVNLRNRAWVATIVPEAQRALWLKESGLPFALHEYAGHGSKLQQ